MALNAKKVYPRPVVLKLGLFFIIRQRVNIVQNRFLINTFSIESRSPASRILMDTMDRKKAEQIAHSIPFLLLSATISPSLLCDGYDYGHGLRSTEKLSKKCQPI